MGGDLSVRQAEDLSDQVTDHPICAFLVGLTRDQARATLRLSIGRTTTDTDVDQAADLITRTAHTLMPAPANAA
ncbi:hypothetical protein ACFWBV_35230 [Streptomyces sp. NPDC060030]|uniref:hypothetical protein n=1 Tax=Streptomyces sp. NPDC060030 TaxID=3347042 RepID=UPI00368D6CCF